MTGSDLLPTGSEAAVAPEKEERAGGPFRTTGQLASLRFYAVVFAPFALGHFLSYVLRSINSVLAPKLISDLSLNAAQIGLLTSVYFFAFAAAQLPVGMALDRYGPRRVQTFLLPVAGLGCLWFSVASGFGALIAARALTGIGLAACFMSSLKAMSDWRPASRMPSMNGYLLGVGGLGAMASTVPVQIAAETIGWRSLFVALGLALALAAVIICVVTPEPAHRSGAAPRISLRSLFAVCRHPDFRRTIGVALVPHAAFFAVQGLWLGAWLDQGVGLAHRTIGLYLLAGMAAMVVGTICVGRFAERAASYGYKTLDVAACGLWAFALLQLLLVLDGRSLPLTIALAFPLFGAFAGLEFAIVAQTVAQTVAPALAGRAATCLNLLVFSLSFALQAGFGAVLGLWSKRYEGAYPAAAYQAAFGVLLILQLPGLLAWTFRKLHGLSPARRSK